MALNKAEINSLQYPFNSAFTKLFSSFNAKIITQCQFYSGYLPISYLADLRCLNFYNICSQEYNSSAGILYHWFGSAEYNAIAEKYNIDKNTWPCHNYHVKMWKTFQTVIDNIAWMMQLCWLTFWCTSLYQCVVSMCNLNWSFYIRLYCCYIACYFIVLLT